MTSEFAPYENDLSKQLSSASELEAGDALNSVPAEHIMLFHSWLNSAKTRARLLEEPGCSSSIPWARVTDSEVTIKSDGHIVVHTVRKHTRTDWTVGGTRWMEGRSERESDAVASAAAAAHSPSPVLVVALWLLSNCWRVERHDLRAHPLPHQLARLLSQQRVNLYRKSEKWKRGLCCPLVTFPIATSSTRIAFLSLPCFFRRVVLLGTN